MWDEDVNRAIDEVARQMTEDAPPASADFRRRVLARIASTEAPRASWRAAFVLSPIAVAAAIVIVTFVRSPAPVGPGVPQPAPPVATAPSDMAGPKGPALQIPSGRLSSVRRAGPFGPGVSRGPGSFEPGVLEPAPQVDSIAVEPLVVGALAPEPIHIERIETITPVTVAPLEIITDIQRREE